MSINKQTTKGQPAADKTAQERETKLKIARDLAIVDNIPLDQPMNDEEIKALGRLGKLRDEVGETRFSEICGKLQAIANQFNKGETLTQFAERIIKEETDGGQS